MDLDHDRLPYERVIHKASILLKYIADELISVIKSCMKEILELIELLSGVEVIKKLNYKPVKEIKPNKVVMLNKRLTRYYCRNNC